MSRTSHPPRSILDKQPSPPGELRPNCYAVEPTTKRTTWKSLLSANLHYRIVFQINYLNGVCQRKMGQRPRERIYCAILTFSPDCAISPSVQPHLSTHSTSLYSGQTLLGQRAGLCPALFPPYVLPSIPDCQHGAKSFSVQRA